MMFISTDRTQNTIVSNNMLCGVFEASVMARFFMHVWCMLLLYSRLHICLLKRERAKTCYT